ncbi:LOW QUALITY PROTEIN: hypothetical protein Cgig2_005795 [Carnegiea gigantea]|uniref:Aminotransferase-like plant mobile domain-containing protein n=1 Tax=Carnegiea gigantea TaxID=171969 RepID=A0A9Q1KJQ6_9CARY|nr:LOW QUALITY PROTEIN: hypothetical protein Cgig2_005795 [Carnegiea gigantea]
MFPRSLIRETGPLTQEYCLLSSMQEPMGGMIVRSFLISWEWLKANLCTFILPIRHVGCCMRPGTFSVASFMASGVGHCLPPAILYSIYKVLNEISHSSHPGTAKNFDTYKVDGEASSGTGMVKSSRLGQAKSFQLEEARELIGFGRGFHWHSSIIGRLKETLMDDNKLWRAEFVHFHSFEFVSYRRQFGFHQDVLADMDFDNLPDPETMLRCHHVLTRYGTGSQILLPERCNLLEKNITRAFYEWWSKMFISLTYSPHAGDSKRKRSDLSDTNVSKDDGKFGSKSKLKIVRSRKPLEPFVPLTEDASSRVKIPGIDVVIPATPIPTILTPVPAIPVQSIAPLPHVTNDIKEHFKSSPLEIYKLPIVICEPSTEKGIELPPEGAANIMNILDVEPNPTTCMGEIDDVNFKEELAHIPLPSGNQCFSSIKRIPSFGKDLFDRASRLDGSKGVCSPNDDEVESIRRANALSLIPRPQHHLRAPLGGTSVFNADTVINEVDKNATRVFGKAILDKMSRTPFDGLPSLKGDFNSLYATIFQRGVDVTLLESKVG